MRKKSLKGLRLVILGAIFVFGGACLGEQDKLLAIEAFGNFSNNVFENLPERMVVDSNDIFIKNNNIIALMLAGGASVAMHNSSADDNLNDNCQKHRGFNDSTEVIFDYAGNPGMHFAATGLWYLSSVTNHDDFNTDRAWTMITALSINGLTTLGLKAIRHNDTPNGKSWAWPSGHTSSSFTVASVLDEFYGPKVGIPAYIAASMVGWRMMDTGDHWASDVVFGATLGWIVGHTVAGQHKQIEIAGFELQPYTVSSSGQAVAGAMLFKRF